ncbi:MAG: hypothetical protein M1541_01255, partial [Acidobacteria bacterium]|nr:hypothetical protein [Acidobacteriota bacterium]
MFQGQGPRAGHEVRLELPVLAKNLEIFIPGDDGVVKLAERPDYAPAAYASYAWRKGTRHVLPLVSVFDPAKDTALTVALPADANIPHLQVAWRGAKTLVLTMAHRGMGGGKTSPLRVLVYAHAADYRSALKVYTDAFPAYFKPALPRGPYEGAFYYHHIQAHPDFAEMARQGVRYIWTSFWFTHLGEYLPAAGEWHPYTYAKWWKLGETMSDEKIRTFARSMHEHGVGVYAYFNVTEYGGAGGKGGDPAEAQRLLREQFANALFHEESGKPVPTWEGSMAMNPDRRYALWPHLEEQVRRHLARLPEIDGFVIDRLDWASRLDYAHDDGFTMVGGRPAENMAMSVGEAVRAVCRMAHAAGKRVYVNQFYRVEVLRDVDGYCHENDYLPGLGYLSPYRPAAAWHLQSDYVKDPAAFETHLKQRLRWALFPQMIAREFPISQQKPDPRAAALLEEYAPLFDALRGASQVLAPHVVDVSGANDANVFESESGSYVIPVTSRTSFLADQARESVTLTLRLPEARRLTKAEVRLPGSASAPARLKRKGDRVEIDFEGHGAASVVVVHARNRNDQRTKGM